jgi:signal peptidase
VEVFVLRNLLRRKHASSAVLVLLLAAWYALLAPTSIGGGTAYVEVSGHSMDGTYQTGDLVVTRRQDSYSVGDVITFRASGGQVIHRIIEGNEEQGYRTQGDNNPDADPWRPKNEDVVGRAWIRLPGAAWIWHLPANPLFAGGVAGVVTLGMLVGEERRSRRAASAPADPTPALAT